MLLTRRHARTPQSEPGVRASDLRTTLRHRVHSLEWLPAPNATTCSNERNVSCQICDNKARLLTLKAKFLRAWATPGLFSNRLPALTRNVTAAVGWPWSSAATLTPADSTTVAKLRTIRDALRVDALAASIVLRMRDSGLCGERRIGLFALCAKFRFHPNPDNACRQINKIYRWTQQQSNRYASYHN